MGQDAPGSNSAAIVYRRFVGADRMPVYRMFRETVWDYMLSRGMVGADDRYDVEQYFEMQQDYYLHLESTAAEDWVAEHESLGLVGWARSIERDGHLQLTHFFVDPKAQGGGIGRQLLDRAFPPGRGRRRSIIATTSSQALSLYLRFGVNFEGMAFTFYGEPQRRDWNSDLQVERPDDPKAYLDEIRAIDYAVLDYDRSIDLEYFCEQQPAFLLRRRGRAVAYAFGCNGKTSGPAAALDPADLPSVLSQLEISALEAGLDLLWMNIPAMAHAAVDWALKSGYRIDPFHEMLLASEPFLKLDRYLMTESAFTW